jgi:1-acyl-sn-glycerol-3-phosphate acyltransferase
MMIAPNQLALERNDERDALAMAPFLNTHALLSLPLPELHFGDRCLLRSVGFTLCRNVRTVRGLEHVGIDRDPFILAINHSTRLEALVIPALLMLLRGGRRVHFLADWNFRIIPGVGLLYSRSGAITVMRKSAKPRFLNLLKPLFSSPTSSAEQARQHLISGRSIGIFPEGTVNRNTDRLLRGRLGAARLSLETGIAVVPAGLRFPDMARGEVIPEASPMDISFGPPLEPSSAMTLPAWHAAIMTAISAVSGKSWNHQRLDPSRGGDVL